MFFVDRSLGPSGRILQSQLVCARVEFMVRRAALLRDRKLLSEVRTLFSCQRGVIQYCSFLLSSLFPLELGSVII